MARAEAPPVAIASAVACRQLVGITDNPPEDLVTSICGLPYGTNVGASCVRLRRRRERGLTSHL
jgi:hypothetical protein